MTKIYNRSTEKELRRALRQSLPRAEALLWARLRRNQLAGLKFRRQYSVERYVIDFYCAELKLAIELDGDSHGTNDAQQYDAMRQAIIEAYGIRFLRFWNNEILRNTAGVLQRIIEAIEQSPSPRGLRPRPSPTRGEG